MPVPLRVHEGVITCWLEKTPFILLLLILLNPCAVTLRLHVDYLNMVPNYIVSNSIAKNKSQKIQENLLRPAPQTLSLKTRCTRTWSANIPCWTRSVEYILPKSCGTLGVGVWPVSIITGKTPEAFEEKPQPTTIGRKAGFAAR